MKLRQVSIILSQCIMYYCLYSLLFLLCISTYWIIVSLFLFVSLPLYELQIASNRPSIDGALLLVISFRSITGQLLSFIPIVALSVALD